MAGGLSRDEILQRAQEAVSRSAEYGSPEDSFERIATMWSEWLIQRKAFGQLYPIQAADVAVMLTMVKIARLMSNIAHVDSIVDIAGYAACLGEIVTASDQPERDAGTMDR